MQNTGAGTHRPDFFRTHGIWLLALLFLVAVTYRDLLSHEFLTVWDDPQYITDNVFIRGCSWLNLKSAFTRYFVGNFAPLQIISYMLDYTLWGMNPAGYFLANILYHALSGLLLYALLYRFGAGTWGAMLGASIFLVHPAQVENVAWLSQRKSLLAMLFFLAAFHCYLNRKDCETSGRFWYCLSLAAFLLSLLAKSVAVIFPLMLLYLDALDPPPEGWLRRNLDKLPYIAAAAIVGWLSLLAQAPESGGGRIDYPDNPLLVLPLTMLPVFVEYLRILFWPSPDRLSLILDPPFRTEVDVAVLTGAAVLVLLAAAGFWMRRRARPALFWYGLFFLGLVPVSQFVPLLTIMNERYLNFPLLGIAGLAACAFGRLQESPLVTPLKGLIVAGAFCAVAGLSISSYTRSLVWHDAVTLFSDTVPKVPSTRKPWLMLGMAFEASGDADSAEISYQQSELPGPLSEADYMIMGKIFLSRGETARAQAYVDWLRRRTCCDSAVRFLEKELLATGEIPSGKQ